MFILTRFHLDRQTGKAETGVGSRSGLAPPWGHPNTTTVGTGNLGDKAPPLSVCPSSLSC